MPELLTVRTYQCTRCKVQYSADRPDCPLCDLRRRNKDLQTSISRLSNEVAALHEQNQQLRLALEPAEAIREALPLLNDTDRTFLKAALYQYRADHSTMLKATLGRTGRANGFITRPRTGAPQVLVCTSLGGVAIARFYRTACQRSKEIAAMDQLLYAFTLELAGGLDD